MQYAFFTFYPGLKEDRGETDEKDAFLADFKLNVMFKFYAKTTNNLSIELARKYLGKNY